MPNALQHETSPYLLQHADNPVDWMPWSPAALELARREGKPILLSIGYSACHWCHVMAHESFEDEATARLMNELFVNIKVDREERPDLDRIYQTSQQLFSGRAGGWPLTVFLTPEAQWPIFAGTYFPKEPAFGLPSFRDVLTRVADYFRNHRAEIDATSARLRDAFERLTPAPGEAAQPSGAFRKAARLRLGQSFDAVNGGFGDAPKFPHATEIAFLMRDVPGDPAVAGIVERSLRAMATGGLFDHLGGGFFRYCVDADWRIPHFEKMLYDNAALLGLYSDAFARTGEPLFRGAAVATAEWLRRDMRHADGAFYATLDADSEGEEGRYYTFDGDEITEALDPDEREAIGTYFGLVGTPNFEQRSWHLQSREHTVPWGQAEPLVESGRRKLLAQRETRTPPGRDDKILTSWNGLMAASLARAARCLREPELGHEAVRTIDFIRDRLWQDGRLSATWQDGRPRFAAYLDDYALTAHALIELLQWQFRPADLTFAIALAETMLAHFADPAGGFFFTADDHETLIHRPKPLVDESLPSGNGVAALVLDTLGHLIGEPRYLDAAARTVRAALPSLGRYPESHATLLRALDRQLQPPELLIVRGPASELATWRARIGMPSNGDRLQFFIDADAGELPGLLAERTAHDVPVAYLCRGTACEAPLADLDSLIAALEPGVASAQDIGSAS